MKNFIQEGQMMTVPAPYTVSSGDGVKVGSLFGVAAYSAVQGQSLEIATGGVFDLAKAPGDTPALGGKVYWDDAAKVVTTASAGNAFIGVAAMPAIGTSPVARTRLNGFAQ